MKRTATATALVCAASALLLAGNPASAVTINFNELAEGAIVSTQYAALGATFAPNAFTGPGITPGEDWATNTNMAVTSTDLGTLGDPVGLVDGKVLRTFNGWLAEDGDPSFSISFSSPISAFSAAFAGVTVSSDVRIYAYNGTTLLGITSGPVIVPVAQFVLSTSAASITKVNIVPGSFNDWVAVDNINFTVAVVPEPATYGMMALGLGLLAFKRRRG